MRIAVLGDVHGNAEALHAVLEDVGRHAPDRVVMNGDLVNRGPEGVEVVRSLEGFEASWTLGNHDDLLCRIVDEDESLPRDFRQPSFWDANRWCAAALEGAGLLHRFRGLPMTVAIDEPGAPRVLVSHGSPRHFREGYGRGTTAEIISEIVEMHPAEVLVGSHTHRPLLRRWGRITVLNTGAIGAPFNGDVRAQYLLLSLEDGAWRPTFRRVAYDVGAALRAYEASGYLRAGGLLAELFRAEVRDARSYLVPFQMWCEERGATLGRPAWERYVAERGEPFVPAPAPALPTESVPPPDADA